MEALLATLNETVAIDHGLLVQFGEQGTLVWAASPQHPGGSFDAALEASYCASKLAELAPGEQPASNGTPRLLFDAPDSGSELAGADSRIAERIFVVFARERGTAVLGLYRRAACPRLIDTDKYLLAHSAEMLAALADTHIRLGGNRSVPKHIEHAWNAVLSERERAVAKLLAQGETARTIAALLGVAPTSVITYKKRAYVKLGVSRQCELAALVGSLG